MNKPLEGRDFLREKIRERDGHECQECGEVWEDGMRRFDVHHVGSIRKSSENRKYKNHNPKRLVTICHRCHMNDEDSKKAMRGAKRPFLKEKNRKTLVQLIKKGVPRTDIAKRFGVSAAAVNQCFYRLRDKAKPLSTGKG
jgi:5-methylcytosine-specific restriction endonuclease McrA